MKKTTKKFLLSVFVVLMVFTCALLCGKNGVDVKSADVSIATTASAATQGYYSYEVSNGEAKITRVDTKINGKVTVPSKLGGYPVTSIGNYAFEECSAITSIIIPDSVTSIGNEVFSLCVRLADISLPDSLTSLGSDICWDTAYYKNKDNWDNNALYVGNHLIGVSHEAITDGTYVIREGTKTIAGHAFVFCELLTNITIPDSVVSIGRYAFLGCEKLTKIIIPASVTSIKEGAFTAAPVLSDVYYCGTQKQWKSIKKEASNEALTKATIHYNYCEHKYETITTPATLTKNGSIKTACTGCGAVKSSTTISYPKTFTLSATSYTFDGKVKVPTVTVKDSADKVLKKGTDYTVTYSEGRKDAGTYSVTVTMQGNYTGTKTLAFKINPISISTCTVKLENTSYTFDGKVKAPKVTVTNSYGTKLTKGKHYTVTYAEDRKNVGIYKVTVKMMGNYTGTKTLTFKINPIKISDCTVKLSETGFTFDGKVKSPIVTVTNPNGTKLTKNKHYTVTYAEGRKNAGTYKVTVKMIGNYSGTKTLTFKITPVKISACTVKLSSTSFTYNGNVQTPALTVKNSNGKALTKGTDYTVKLESGRKMPGRYTVTVTGKGNYSGTKKLTYTIAPKATTKISATQTATTVTLTWNKVAGATGYRVYQYNSIKKEWVTVKTLTANTCKVTGLSSGTTYKFRVKAYKDDNGAIWGAASATFTAITKLEKPKITSLTSGKGKAVLKWSDVNGENGYEFYYSTKKDSGFKKLATADADALSYTKYGLTSGKTYYFKIRAYKTVGDKKLYSAWSDVKGVKIK